MHVVAVDLGRHASGVEGERALGRFFGRERVSAMAGRITAAGPASSWDQR
jgi:hypothetical protein